MQNRSKPPILIFNGFLSPLKCSQDNVVPYSISKAECLFDKLSSYFDTDVISVSGTLYEPTSKLQCGNGFFYHKWHQTDNSSFIGYVPLKSYNNKPPFDIDTDIYGGTMVLTQYSNKLQPEVGRLCVFPSSTNFSHFFEPIQVGQMSYIKLSFYTKNPFKFVYSDWQQNWRF